MTSKGPSRTFEFTIKMRVDVYEPTPPNTGIPQKCPPTGTNEACDWHNAQPAIELVRALLNNEERLREYLACEALAQLRDEWPLLVDREWATLDRNPAWLGHPRQYSSETILRSTIEQLDPDVRSVLERWIAEGLFGESTPLLDELVQFTPVDQLEFTVERE